MTEMFEPGEWPSVTMTRVYPKDVTNASTPVYWLDVGDTFVIDGYRCQVSAVTRGERELDLQCFVIGKADE